MSEIDDLRDFLVQAEQQRNDAAAKLAEYVRANGDDPIAYQLADTILVLNRQLRSLRKHLMLEYA